MPRYKILFWLLLHDRLNVRNVLQRNNFHLPNYNCAICTTCADEPFLHLFWDCPFAQDCWAYVDLLHNRGIFVLDDILLNMQALPK